MCKSRAAESRDHSRCLLVAARTTAVVRADKKRRGTDPRARARVQLQRGCPVQLSASRPVPGLQMRGTGALISSRSSRPSVPIRGSEAVRCGGEIYIFRPRAAPRPASQGRKRTTRVAPLRRNPQSRTCTVPCDNCPKRPSGRDGTRSVGGRRKKAAAASASSGGSGGRATLPPAPSEPPPPRNMRYGGGVGSDHGLLAVGRDQIDRQLLRGLEGGWIRDHGVDRRAAAVILRLLGGCRSDVREEEEDEGGCCASPNGGRRKHRLCGSESERLDRGRFFACFGWGSDRRRVFVYRNK